MKRNINKNEIFLSLWKEVSIDEMVNKHIAPKNIIINKEEAMSCIKATEPIYKLEDKPRYNKEKLRLKYMSLSDLIINRCYGERGSATFSSKILKCLYGDYYKDMLRVLRDFNLIDMDNEYSEGKAKTIWLKDLRTTTKKYNSAYLVNYKLKLNNILERVFNRRLPKCIALQYKEALNTITFDKEQALLFVDNKYSGENSVIYLNRRLEPEEVEGLKKWRIGMINGFTTDKDIKRDNNGRIYHCLTNMPKDLLPFTNIKYEMDAANCHPMLFVTELIKYFNIGKETMQTFSNVIISNGNADYYSVSKELKKKIKCKLPIDVIHYILLVFSGKFWDENLKKYDVHDRTTIKKNFFSEVFYSYNNNIAIRDKEDYRRVIKEKKYAKDFRETYPNVWKVLGYLKRNGKAQLVEKKIKEERNCNEVKNKLFSEVFGKEVKVREEAKFNVKNNILPNSLMKIESEIFIKILEKLLPSFDVINIHDAIVVIDSPKNKNLTSEMVEKTMLEVFSEYCLFPTIKKSIPRVENK